MSILFLTLGIVLVLLGLWGIFLPVLPGIPLIFLGLVFAAAMDGFVRVGWIPLTILGVLTLLSFVIDYVATFYGVKKAAATKEGIIGVVLGTVIGLFMGFPGIVLGPLIGAMIGELYAHQDLRQASKVGLYAWAGLLIGTVSKLALAFIMIGIFIFAVIF